MWNSILKNCPIKSVITQYARSPRRNACNEESKKRTCLTRAGIHADLKVGRANSFFLSPSPRGLLNQRSFLSPQCVPWSIHRSWDIRRYPWNSANPFTHYAIFFFRCRRRLAVQDRKVGRSASEVSAGRSVTTVYQLQGNIYQVCICS